MNYAIFFLFLLLFQVGMAQDDDYIKDTSGLVLYGKIKKGTPAAHSKSVHFKTKGGKIQEFDATQLLEWGTEDKVYHSKRFPITSGDTVAVFMELISEEDGMVRAYEFFNSYQGSGVQTLLERDSVFTEVLFGQFKKQMKAYFVEQPEVVELILDSRAGKENLLVLIAEFNDLMLEPIEVIMARIEEKKGNKLSKKTWNLSDMLLSQEVATKKYQEAMSAQVTNTANDPLKNIEINSTIATSFFEQKQYDAALPLFILAKKDILRYNVGKEKLPRIEAMLATIYINDLKFTLAAFENSLALEHWKNVGIDSLNLALAYRAYLNHGIIFKYLDASADNINYYKPIVPEEEKWESALKRRGHVPIVHSKEAEKSIDYSLALLCFRKAQDLIGQFPKEQHTVKQIEVGLELGALYFEAGDYPSSKKHYEAALNLMKSHHQNKHPKLAETTRILGEICLAEQLYNEALTYVDQAQYVGMGSTIEIDQSLLKNINKIPFPFELLNSIVTKGIILYQKNKANPSEIELKKVLAHYAFATELLKQLRNTQRNEGSDYTLANVTHKLSQHAVIICNTLFELTKKQEYLSEAFHYAELSKSAVLYETVHDLKSLAVSGIPKEQITKETGLKTQIAYLKGEIFYALQESAKTRDEEAIKEIEKAIVQITKEHNDLILYFEKNYPDYFALKYNHKSIELTDLQKILAPNEVFLEYVATDSFIYVLAIDNKSIQSKFTPLKEALHHTAKQLHFALKNNKADSYETSGRLIYEATIGGIASFIKGKKLIISPDAELHYIPFGVLPTNKEPIQEKGDDIYKNIRFLIEDYPICYNHSATLFALSKKQKKSTSSKKIATWAPNFDLMGEILKEKGIAENLVALPGAQKEASQIADIFGATPFLEHDASEAKFKQFSSEYSVLHIATHGILNDVDPLFSSLILSNAGEEDGILHAFELYNMSINADLAVLSACNSGMGKLTKAEGVVSIARAFSYAGVPNIVMSKWPVSDWATAVLMKSFYEKLQAGMPKDEALQQAKIEYIQAHRAKGKSKLLAPFFWGGFVLNGNPDPIPSLSGTGFSPYLFYGGGLIIVVMIVGGGFWWLRRRKAAATNP